MMDKCLNKGEETMDACETLTLEEEEEGRRTQRNRESTVDHGEREREDRTGQGR